MFIYSISGLADCVGIIWYYCTWCQVGLVFYHYIKMALNHPSQGRAQMIRKHVDQGLYCNILENPRVHTTQGCQTRIKTKRLSSSKCAFMYKMMLNPKSYIILSIISTPSIISRQLIPHFIDYISPQFVRPFLGKIVLSSSSKRCNSHLRHKLFIFL